MTGNMDGQFRNSDALQKRAEELKCLYHIKDILRGEHRSPKEICTDIAVTIPSSMSYPDDCRVKIVFDRYVCTSGEFQETEWCYCSDINFQNNTLGQIKVYYTKEYPTADSGPFYKEEIRLIDTVAGLLGQYLVSLDIKRMILGNKDRCSVTPGRAPEWPALVDILKRTNRELYYRICRKILNVLNWDEDEKVKTLLKSVNSSMFILKGGFQKSDYYSNQKTDKESPSDISQIIIDTARTYISDDIMLKHIQRWIQEEKLSYLSQVVNRNLSIEEVADSIRRYYEMAPASHDVRNPSKWGIQVSLIRRFLSEQPQYINTAKHLVDICDFRSLLKNLVFSVESRGKLGGKNAMLFLVDHIIKKELKDNRLFENVKIPRTWFISSDVIYHFMHYNNFDDVVEQKYKDIDQIVLEYPQIVEFFKNGQFPEDIIKKLSAALDDLHDNPLIVRSSSLLENQIGSTFFEKYKSVLLINKGTKRQRLDALMKAVAKVYASTFSPVSLEYRRKHDLIDFAEEMGIMIQEVVGLDIGNYYLPLCSGIAYSDNVYRWSDLAKAEDGLICIAPGLRTCTDDDNETELTLLTLPDSHISGNKSQVIKKGDDSSKSILVLDKDKEQVVRMELNRFLHNNESELKKLSGMESRVHDAEFSFQELIESSSLPRQVIEVVRLIKEKLEMPVEIDFAYDGTNLNILQCRAYNYLKGDTAIPIPREMPDDQILFKANRYIADGSLRQFKYIIYIDTLQYRDRISEDNVTGVRDVVKQLNLLLPRKQFIVICPWTFIVQTEQDYKLVTSIFDIENAAALLEIESIQHHRTSECSFNPHLFHQLVSNDIQYFVINEDNESDVLNLRFLKGAYNFVEEMAPAGRQMSNIVRVIDISKETNGKILSISANMELNEAIGLFASPEPEIKVENNVEKHPVVKKENNWQWRLRMVENLASRLDPERFGVKNLYLFGSTKNASAGPGSDIDLMIHHSEDPEKLRQLKLWIEGWSLCLSDINYLRTGYRSDGLLDVQYITDEDIAIKTSFATMINAVTDRARKIPLKDPNKKGLP